MITHQARVDAAEIDASVRRALGLLRYTFRSPPGSGEAGWYHYLDDPRPGITASAVGLCCFSVADQLFERSDEVVRYIVANQVPRQQGARVSAHDEELLRGGWPIRTTE